jgi:hypothetical protein
LIISRAFAKRFLAQNRVPALSSQLGQGSVRVGSGADVDKIQVGFIQHCFKIIKGVGDAKTFNYRVPSVRMPITQGHDFCVSHPGPGIELDLAPRPGTYHSAAPGLLCHLAIPSYQPNPFAVSDGLGLRPHFFQDFQLPI